MSSVNPEKWQEIKEIFYAALRLAPDEREQFLNESCKDDDHLRREVESLLSSSESAGSFMQDPAVAAVADVVVAERSKKLRKGEIVGHYKILQELGAGGQGAVYQALDMKLNRSVALKMLPAELTVDETSRKRFQREAQLASALDHPNICTVHELTEIDGTHFIVMQFVAGRNIRELVGGRPLELQTALKIAIQVSDALAAAHAQGIIHRDIKAHNIIVTDKGQAKTVDFGLAKLVRGQANGTEETELTTLGSPYGTPTYAAPEQSRGERVDHRADIFSTGVLLYEMLAGTWAFHGKTAVDVRHAVLYDEPKPIADRRGEQIPEKLQKIVNRALAKRPGARFQDIADMRDELIEVLLELPGGEASDTARFLEQFKPFSPRRIVTLSKRAKLSLASAALLVLIFAGFLFYRSMNTQEANAQPKPIESIAVMLFVNESGSADVEYLSDGMTETLIGSLSQLPNLRVKSRSSVFRYKGKDSDVQTIGRELDVQAILTGRVVQHGDDLTLFLSLVDATSENNLWSKQYNRKLTNLIALQSDIARDVASNLGTKLSGADERKVAKNYTENVEAYQLYLKGRHHILTTRQSGTETGVSYYRQAIRIDPNFALAYAGLAEAAVGLVLGSEMPPKEVFAEAKADANKAIELDDQLTEAYVALGYISLWYDWDWKASENHLKRAIEINAKNAEAHLAYGILLFNTGRRLEGLAEIKTSVELEPLNFRNNAVAGQFLNYAGQHDEALARFQQIFELEPNFYLAHPMAAHAYIEKGKFPEAIAEARTARELNPLSSFPIALQGYALAKSGNQAEARALLKELLKLSEKRYVTPLSIALIYNGLGERDETLRWLERGVEQRDLRMTFLKAEPKWNNLRSDVRFQEIIRRVGLPE